uniref:Peptidase A1 domain-containing protein n=1 Tax=Leersia perrieri TaxID=77586 RepID=A0A0D9WPN6_9ORYZ
MPLVHRRGPCGSPLGGARSNDNEHPTADDVFDRDALRLRSLFAARQGGVQAAAEEASLTIPATSTPISVAPGALEYRVLAGYGTPVQRFNVAFDTNYGASVLRCKPCFASAAPCEPAFDPFISSSFAAVACGSPECSAECTDGSSRCPFTVQFGNTTVANGTLVRDTLTLSPSATISGFTFGCIEAGADALTFDAAVGLIDLSRNTNSLASGGFLSVGASRPEYNGSDIKYAPMSSNPNHPNSYFVHLVGISIGGEDLPVQPTVFAAAGTMLEVATEFTFLVPAAYAALRDVFRREMAQYPPAPPFRALDTCYNFTGTKELSTPVVALRFNGGTVLELDAPQMMYFTDPSDVFSSVGCLAFAAAPLPEFPVSVIGTLAQRSTEVVYDVRGGRVGFIPGRC